MMQGPQPARRSSGKSWDSFQDLFQERYGQGLIAPEKMRELVLTHRDFIDRMYMGGNGQ